MPRIYIKRLCYILLILGLYTTNIYAASFSSSNYTLIMPRIVVSSGSISSSNYSIKSAVIGDVFSGVSTSANYTLNTNKADIINEKKPPNPPILNPVTSPTNNVTQTLSGLKEKNTSIYINGYEAVPINNEVNWSYNFTLVEGDNHLFITARNTQGLESSAVTQTITLDITPPLIIITNPIGSTIVYTNPIILEGTIDGVPFSEQINLTFGPNTITKEASDEAGNSSAESVEVYLIRVPLEPPPAP